MERDTAGRTSHLPQGDAVALLKRPVSDHDRLPVTEGHTHATTSTPGSPQPIAGPGVIFLIQAQGIVRTDPDAGIASRAVLWLDIRNIGQYGITGQIGQQL